MALVPNIPTDYAELIGDVLGGNEKAAIVLASKSGKSPFDAAMLTAVCRIAQALENKYA